MTAENEHFVNESPLLQASGASKAYSITVSASDGSTPVITTVGGSVTVYKNGSGDDLSGSLTTGSASASGDTYTTPTITGLTGNNFYICSFYATINGAVDLVGRIKFICDSDKADQ